MSSVFDMDPPGGGTKAKAKETEKRSKNRESLNQAEMSEGRRTLFQKVQMAFQTLEDAMSKADYPTAVKAATVILDRTGFGPKTTVDVNNYNHDLSELTTEQLADRAKQVEALLRSSGRPTETLVAQEPTSVS